MDFIAHIREGDKKIQTVNDHLLGAKELAEIYGEKIGVKHIAGLAGMLHDLGKYTNEFRDYILDAVHNPDAPPKRGKIDHSTAGGKLLYELFHIPTINFNQYTGLLAEVVGNAIISHHSYIQDFISPDLESNYLNRVRDKQLPEFDMTTQAFFEHVMSKNQFQMYVNNAAIELEYYLSKESSKDNEKQLMFLIKFIFSALIDADRTNTRLFEENKTDEPMKNNDQLFSCYYDRLMKKINSFKTHDKANSSINHLRSVMSDQCENFADKPSGIYTLSIPTGGGKTLASLRYALNHAKHHHKNRIIYVVPFTTIIEQNAEEIRKILKDNANILEHHSNIIEDSNNDENESGIISIQQKLKLAKDNWNSPIIFTTMVQFLNVFYAKGSRNIRRLHNLSDSIIIFDEVQKVPTKCVSLFNYALNFLKTYCHCSIVLCTATQPALDFVEHKLEINTDAEIIDQVDHVINAFKRVKVVDMATREAFNNDKLTEFIELRMKEEVQSLLIILNTKSVVNNLYEKLKDNEEHIPVYHLSTSMCAAHRVKILDEVRRHLNKGNKIICISTQLIEAGVDVSFNCVIRSLAGLDSIAQAAGRCNRHGERDIQNVYIIDHMDEKLDHLKEIKVGKQISRRILIDIKNNKAHHGGDILSRQAMDRYFNEYYTELQSDLNYFIPKLKKDMMDLLSEKKSSYSSFYQAYKHNKGKGLPLFIVNSYKTAAENFRVIDDNTTSVIVPYEDGKEIIAELNSNNTINNLTGLLQKAQQYTVNIYSYEREILEKNDGLVSYLDGKILALTEGAYNNDVGLNIENDSQFDCLIK